MPRELAGSPVHAHEMARPALKTVGMQTTKSLEVLGLPRSLMHEELSRDWGQVSKTLPLSHSLSKVTQQQRRVGKAGGFHHRLR